MRSGALVAVLVMSAAAGTWARSGASDDGPAAPPAAPKGAPVPDAPSTGERVREGSPEERGFRWLTTKSYIPPTFDRVTLEGLWTVWPEPLRTEAERASPDARRRLMFDRYGFTPLASDPTKPLQYVEDDRGRLSISCLACHSGALAGRSIPGLPNANFAFQSLADDIVAFRARTGARPPSGALLPFPIPLGESIGTTNAVVFSVALLTFRDKDLNLVFPKKAPRFVHHDLDAPPWWNVKKRDRLYIDGFAKKGHRALMQFLMVPTNGPDRVKGWEKEFEDVLAYVESLEAPAWNDTVEQGVVAALAAKGRAIFERACASCHGTYGAKATYPGVDVAIDDIGTDRVRHEATTAEERAQYGASWFTNYEPSTVRAEPKGYVAPPLDGVFASAPYFHNGAVPTLWHVLHPDARPKAWRRRPGAPFDPERVGLDVETRDAVPTGLEDGHARRSWFDTTQKGKRADGHRFPEALSEDERRAVLEYLKTL